MKAMLSGMSPGGFFSAGTGFFSRGAAVAGVPEGADVPVGGGGAGLPAACEVVGWELQPASRGVTASKLSRLIPPTLDSRLSAAGQPKVNREFALPRLQS